MKFIFLFSLILSSIHAAHALQVTPGSSCASACLASGDAGIHDATASSTNSGEIACQDLDFSTKENGIKFQTCLECLQKSDTVNGTESDQKWFLYNLRYAVSTCIFSEPTSISKNPPKNKCATANACLPFESVLSPGLTKGNVSEVYNYCTANNAFFTEGGLEPCLSCLQDSENQVFMSNFITALEAGCKEHVKDGMIIGLDGPLFSKNAINMTTPTDSDKSKGDSSSGISKPVLIVICVGVSVLVLAAVMLFFVYWRRHKKPFSSNKAISLRSNSTTPDPHLPPADLMMSESLRTFRAGSSLEQGPGTMTAGEYYDQSELQARRQNMPHAYNPALHVTNANAAIPTHQAYNPSTVSRNAPRQPWPPATVHQHSRSDPLSSYIIQAYVPSSEQNPTVPIQQPSHARTISSNSHLQRIPMPIPPAPPRQQQQQPKHSKVPSLSLPSVPKVRVPKQYTPPQISNRSAGTSHDDQQQLSGVQISGPIMDGSSRFHDRLGGAGMSVPIAQQIPSSQLKVATKQASTSPLRTGKSTLFGGY